MMCSRYSASWTAVSWAIREHHRSDGELSVEAPRVRWEILDKIIEAGDEIGIPKIADPNSGDNEGSTYFHVNQKRGRRWSAARGFLRPALHRPNLRLETGVQVETVTFDGKRATARALPAGQSNHRSQGRGRSDPVRGRHRIGADIAALRRGAGSLAGAIWALRYGMPRKVWAAICRITCSCASCIAFKA